MRTARLLEMLATVPDPRDLKGRPYPLAPILALLLVGTILGRRCPKRLHNSPTITAATSPCSWGSRYDDYPPYSRLSKLLPRIDVRALEEALRAWIATRLPPDEPLIVNLDGTCVRGSGQRPTQLPRVHRLAAFAPRVLAVLPHLRVDDEPNAHRAALGLLNTLPPRRVSTSSRAMPCTPNFASVRRSMTLPCAGRIMARLSN